MPFTTAHPALVLPLKQLFPRYVSLTGLVAGAMAPDLLYFLCLTTDYRGVSHSWTGLLLFCLPAGLAFCFVFHWWFKGPFLRHFPAPLDRFFSGLADRRWLPTGRGQWLVLILSLTAGALSHFFWDSWTHADGVVAQSFPWLLEHLDFAGLHVRYTELTQHLSTLFGTILILWYIASGRLIPPAATRPQSARTPGQKVRFWLTGLACSVILAFGAVWLHFGSLTLDPAALPGSFHLYHKLGLGSWAGFFWAACAYTVAGRLIERTRSGAVSSGENLKS
ncbi:MAG TPA: DUF4184 family protein [Acidobacteriota bacterium]|nr:DUF4184 family protein [Acidobacteriota bacterium]